ncbi:hypothetical protein PLICRDRAFT_632447, partial [Plicaturopsis crispa FD-325 SS-3]
MIAFLTHLEDMVSRAPVHMIASLRHLHFCWKEPFRARLLSSSKPRMQRVTERTRIASSILPRSSLTTAGCLRNTCGSELPGETARAHAARRCASEHPCAEHWLDYPFGVDAICDLRVRAPANTNPTHSRLPCPHLSNCVRVLYAKIPRLPSSNADSRNVICNIIYRD